MSFNEIIEKLKQVQTAFLKYLEEESDVEENYQNLVNIIIDQKIVENKHKLKSLMRLINVVSNNHQRVFNFISKIEQILIHFKKDITQFFSSLEIFNFFETNKRIILFLIEENMIVVDEYLVLEILKKNTSNNMYLEYFAPEIKPFFTEEFINKYNTKNIFMIKEEFVKEIAKEMPNEFYEKRKEGLNDNYLCELIRTNDAKQFGIYVNKNNISLDSNIEKSAFETNYLLYSSSHIKLIEYASFYGSNDIVRYLHVNEAKLTHSMWLYAIHSQNDELIKFLEDNSDSNPLIDYEKILKESIKCHHNDLTNYIILNLIKEEYLQFHIEHIINENQYAYSVKFHNYIFFPENFECKYLFFYLCQYDYYILVNYYLQHKSIDINAQYIKNINILNQI